MQQVLCRNRLRSLDDAGRVVEGTVGSFIQAELRLPRVASGWSLQAVASSAAAISVVRTRLFMRLETGASALWFLACAPKPLSLSLSSNQ